MTQASKLTLDFTGLTRVGVGAAGIDDTDLDGIAERAAAAVDKTRGLRQAGKVGFFDLPDDRDGARRALQWAQDLPPQIDTMVVLGIGGSSLGPHAVYSALGRPLDALRPRSPGMPRRLLFPDNSDPVTFEAILEVCPLERTVFCVVTKSGSTAETAAQLLVVYKKLEDALGAEGVKRHLVAITDPSSGVLRRAATELGLDTFEIPPSVGGRFSVLSAVGLLPAAAAGLDVMGLLEGARRMRDRVIDADDATDVRKNPALMLAALLYLHHTERQRPQVVMMPYADNLYDCADWFRQLWAESLGKERSVTGEVVNVGPTPIASRGATDQHSQLQLYAEGPADKVFLMLTARERGSELVMPESALTAHPEFAYLAGKTMGELLDAELWGTVGSLSGRGRPTATITLDRVDAEAIGELLLLLEAATAFAGPLYGVDPYDQPGVEEAKKLAYAALGREGYQELARERQAPEPDARYVFR
jgi:glucose-6-phosphate isomerase